MNRRIRAAPGIGCWSASLLAAWPSCSRLAANLNHPNIVQVFELGRDIDENLFISMELVNGVELTTLLDSLRASGKTMPEAAALEITIQVLRGLHQENAKRLRGRPAWTHRA